jgi:hypothetical protein
VDNLRSDKGIAAPDSTPEIPEYLICKTQEVPGRFFRFPGFSEPEEQEHPRDSDRVPADIEPVQGVCQDLPALFKARDPAGVMIQQILVRSEENAPRSAGRVKHPEREDFPA